MDIIKNKGRRVNFIKVYQNYSYLKDVVFVFVVLLWVTVWFKTKSMQESTVVFGNL